LRLRVLAIAVATGLALGCGASANTDEAAEARYEPPSPSAASSAKDTTHEFHGYECTQDCSGHDAGYKWAEERDIDDEADCGGNSESFIEGCKAYVQEHDSDDASDDGDG
jgi:hypothetical protein